MNDKFRHIYDLIAEVIMEITDSELKKMGFREISRFKDLAIQYEKDGLILTVFPRLQEFAITADVVPDWAIHNAEEAGAVLEFWGINEDKDTPIEIVIFKAPFMDSYDLALKKLVFVFDCAARLRHEEVKE